MELKIKFTLYQVAYTGIRTFKFNKASLGLTKLSENMFFRHFYQ